MEDNKEIFVKLVTILGCGIGTIFLKELTENRSDKRARIKQIPLTIKSEEATELYPTNNDFPPISEPNKLRNISPEQKAILDALLSKAVEMGVIAKSYNGLLTCSVSVGDLAKSSDGLLRGYVTNNGRIVKHAKFAPVDIPTPLFCFQIASLITGQYYQQVITQRLDKLNTEVESIKQMIDSQDIGLRETIKQNLTEIMSLSQFEGISDVVRINELRKDSLVLRNKYRDLFLKLNIDVPDLLHICKASELNNWCKKISQSNIQNYMLMAIESEYLYILSTLLLCICHIKIKEESKASFLLNNLDINISCFYASHYHELKCVVLENIKQLQENAVLFKDSCKEGRKKIEELFNRIETVFRQTQASLMLQSNLKVEEGEIKGIII